jgi:hypothetical protein
MTTVDTTMAAICGKWGLTPSSRAPALVLAAVPTTVPEILKYIKDNYSNDAYRLKIVEALRELYTKQAPAGPTMANTSFEALTSATSGLKGSTTQMTDDNAKDNVKAIIPLLNEAIPDSVTRAKATAATVDADAKALIREGLTAAVAFLNTITTANKATLAPVLNFIRSGGAPPTLGGKRRRSKSRKARRSRISRKSRRPRKSRKSRRFKRY